MLQICSSLVFRLLPNFQVGKCFKDLNIETVNSKFAFKKKYVLKLQVQHRKF